MPNLSNHQLSQGNPADLPLCKTRVQWELLIILLIATPLMLCGMLGFVFTAKGSYLIKGLMLVIAALCVLGLRFGFFNFHLYPDRIVIKYPLGFGPKSDEVILLSTLEKVLFTRKTAKTRVVFTINGKKQDYEFEYGKVDEFILHLNRLGVTTEKEGRSPYIF